MRRRQSLLSKIIVGVSLAVLGVEGVALVSIMSLYRRELVRAERRKNDLAADVIERGFALAREEKYGVEALAQAAILDRELAAAGASLYDEGLERVRGSLPEEASRSDPVEVLSAVRSVLLEARDQGKPAWAEGAGRLVQARPLRGGGFLVLVSPVGPVANQLAKHVLVGMAFVLAVLLLTGVAIIWAIFWHILRPIGALTAANRALVEGKEGALVPGEAIPMDELGDAIRSRNDIYSRMLEYQQSIREKNEILSRQGVELKAWTAELERRVRAKTHELERTHDRLLESEKLAATGRLAAGVAHEINNPLASIAGYAEDLLSLAKDPRLSDLPAFADFPESLAVIEEQTYRCKKIIRQLLTFARPAEFAAEPLDLSQIVDDVLPLVEHKARGRDVAILTEERPGTPNALADKAHLMQVLVNLLENAFDAIVAEPGTISVLVRRGDDRGCLGSGTVAIDVRDSGAGIPEAARGKIFDPFFTTKPVGKGTGLGLAICHSIVSRMGGRIEVESETGKGTTFTVHLPATRELAAIEAR